MVSGKSRDDREFEKTIRHMHRDGTANARLRKMEFKRKPQSECHICVVMEDETYPNMVWACRHCVRRIATRYGKIYIQKVMHSQFRPPCEICGIKAVSHYQINIRMCEKCLKRIGKKHMGKGEIHAGVKEYQERVRSYARAVA